MAETFDKTDEIFLVLRCQSSDREAFDALLRSVQTGLWRYISGLTGDRDLALDILQEVFLIIYRKIGWLRDPRLFRAWAYRIATRETFRILKSRSKWKEDVLDESVIRCESHETEVDFDISMLDHVSPASRAVLMLHYVEDLSLSETAEALDVSIGTVKSRLAYGLQVLRNIVQPSGGQ